MNLRILIRAFLFLSLCWLFPSPANGKDGEDKPARSAHDIFLDLRESSLFGRELPVLVEGFSDRQVTYGAEKEGSSSIITRVMGPNQNEFRRLLGSLEPKDRADFQRDLLSGWQSGRYRAKNVKSADGVKRDFELLELRGRDLQKLTESELDAAFDAWLSNAGDRSFSFLKSAVRRRFFNGELPGLSSFKAMRKNSLFQYASFAANFGEAEKYIESAHGTSTGWEINFKPQKTYGAQDKMVAWFRQALSTNGALFEAPGHQWNVFPFPKKVLSGDSAKKKYALKIGELLRGAQAYIVLKGLGGRTGMELTNYKSVHSDFAFRESPLSLARGVVRADARSAFGPDAFGVELRSGTKSDETRRFLQEVLTSRAATGDFSGLEDVTAWSLHEGNPDNFRSYMERFGVGKAAAEKFNALITSVKRRVGNQERVVRLSYLAPLWQWENAPFLADEKKTQLKDLAKHFIQTVAGKEKLSPAELQNILQDWVKASNLERDLEQYLSPAPPVESTDKLMRFRPARAAPGQVDVNDIDLGIEYTGRFQIKPRVLNAPRKNPAVPGGWLETLYDLNPAEREQAIRQVAEELAATFGKGSDAVAKLDAGHGHGLGIAFSVADSQNRSWRVEWDGVSREYDLEDRVIPESMRGGHIELVTPKLKLNGKEVDSVFESFSRQGTLPDASSGGGHINIDLDAFKGKPKQFARFLALFLEHRGVMALMFQHVDRLKSAEPLDASPNLIAKLKNFSGSEEELKKLLYEERWFNARVGRKTRYTQLDISAYFQDVIPAEFVTKDFDLFKDTWRKQFRVDPRIRKAEFRMFNAPKSARESALQTKFVRALLDQALNGEGSLSGSIQVVDYGRYLADPELAEREFGQMMARLGLDGKEYREYLLDGLVATRRSVNSIAHLPIDRRLVAHPKVEGWGRAVKARKPSLALKSEEHEWRGQAEPEAVKYQNLRRHAREQREKYARLAAETPADRLRRAAGEQLGLSAWRSLPEDDLLPFLSSFLTTSRANEKKEAEAILAGIRSKGEYATLLARSLATAGSPGYAGFLALEVKKLPEVSDGLMRALFDSPFPAAHAALKEALDKEPPEKRLEYISEWFEGLARESGDSMAETKFNIIRDAYLPMLPHPLPEDFVDFRLEILEKVILEEAKYKQEVARGLSELLNSFRKAENSRIVAQATEVAMRLVDRVPAPKNLGLLHALLSLASADSPEKSFEIAGQYLAHQDPNIASTAGGHRFNIVYQRLYAGEESDAMARRLLRQLGAVDQLRAFYYFFDGNRPRGSRLDRWLNEAVDADIIQLNKAAGREGDQFLKATMNSIFFRNYKDPQSHEALERFYGRMMNSAEGLSLVEESFAGALREMDEAEMPWLLRFFRQRMRSPGPALLAALQARLESTLGNESMLGLRNEILGTLMQWPEGARLVKEMAPRQPPLRRVVDSASCTRYFQQLGL